MAQNKSVGDQQLAVLTAKKKELLEEIERITKALEIFEGKPAASTAEAPVEKRKPKKRPARRLNQPLILTKSLPKRSSTSGK